MIGFDMDIHLPDTIPNNMESEMFVLKEHEIQDRVFELAGAISADYRGKDVLLLCMMKGAIIFCAELMKMLKTPARLEMAKAKSMTGTRSSGYIELFMPDKAIIRGQNVVVVEDIVDTGFTMSKVLECLADMQPASIEICTLLDKRTKRRPDFVGLIPKYIGFEIPDLFVIGYGLDYNEHFRDLDHVREITQDEIDMYADDSMMVAI